MNFRVLISIFFIITTTFSAVHALEHITQDADSACLVYHLNDNLSPVDIIDKSKDVEIFHFDYISQNSSISNLHVKDQSNPNRAPPLAS